MVRRILLSVILYIASIVFVNTAFATDCAEYEKYLNAYYTSRGMAEGSSTQKLIQKYKDECQLKEDYRIESLTRSYQNEFIQLFNETVRKMVNMSIDTYDSDADIIFDMADILMKRLNENIDSTFWTTDLVNSLLVDIKSFEEFLFKITTLYKDSFVSLKNKINEIYDKGVVNGQIPAGSPDILYYDAMDTLNALINDSQNVYKVLTDLFTPIKNELLAWKPVAKCPDTKNGFLSSDGKCYCKKGYLWSESKNVCVAEVVTIPEKVAVTEPSDSTVSKTTITTPVVTSNTNTNIFINDIKDSKYKASITLLKEKGVISGYPDGTFKPKNRINRAEFIKIVLTAKNISPSGTNCFTDVRKEWYAGYVCQAKNAGILGGYPDGTFKPEKEIILAEALKITFQAFNVTIPNDSTKGDWYVKYVNYAKNNDLWLTTFIDASRPITREDMAEIVYRLGN